MTTSTGCFTIELNINKASALRIATNYFESHKRTNRLHISADNCRLTFEYYGARTDREEIENGLVFIKGHKISAMGDKTTDITF